MVVYSTLFYAELLLFSLQGKLQKHQAFEAEVVANKDRIFSTISIGQGQLSYCDIQQCTTDA